MPHTQNPGDCSPRFVVRAPTGAAQGSPALMILMLSLAAVLAGCHEGQSPTAPAMDQRPPTGLAPDEQPLTAVAVEGVDVPQSLAAGTVLTGPLAAAVAIEDAIERVLPTLGAGGPIAALDAGLRQLRAQLEDGGDSGGLQRALTEVQKAIDRYQKGADEEFEADLGVVQLALDAVAHG